MTDSATQWKTADAEVMRLRAELKMLLSMNETLNSRVEFWRDQCVAANRRKGELYTALMSIRSEIDRAFSSKPEVAT